MSNQVIYGGFWRRSIAYTIDGLIIKVPYMILRFNIPVSFTAALVLEFLALASSITYHLFFLKRFAATPGKLINGLVVRSASGGHLDWPMIIRRQLIIVIIGIGNWALFFMDYSLYSKEQLDLYFAPWAAIKNTKLLDTIPHYSPTLSTTLSSIGALYVLASIILVVFHKKRQALHDFVGGTVVVLKESEAHGNPS